LTSIEPHTDNLAKAQRAVDGLAFQCATAYALVDIAYSLRKLNDPEPEPGIPPGARPLCTCGLTGRGFCKVHPTNPDEPDLGDDPDGDASIDPRDT
jgi:hypothetical protein